MTITASALAQTRFHRFVAVLLATAVPLVATANLVWSSGSTGVTVAKFAGSAAIAAWAVVVARAERPNAIPLALAALIYTGALVLLEELYDVELTVFDFGTAFALLMLYAVLIGTLSMGSRLRWAAGLALFISAWVLVIGILANDPVGTIVARIVVAIAGVALTTALVGELFSQLIAAIDAYDQSRRLRDAVAHCSEALLVHPGSSALEAAVRALLEATDAGYAYIDRTVETDDGPGWEILAGAGNGGNLDTAGWNKGLYAEIPAMYESLLDGQAVVIKTEDLTGESRALYEEDGILSEISVPIFVDSEFRGSMGFVDSETARDWSEEELQTLWRAADMIGAFWKRQDDERALEASNEAKDKLLASVSHELRTPLTAIVGLSEEIVSRRVGPDDLEELTRIIAAQSRELSELVEDLLVASRADFGHLSIRPEIVDLGEQVEMVTSILMDKIGASRVLTVSGGCPDAWADPLRVRQIIRNLVTNALKYGGDHIDITLRHDDDRAHIVVSDDGAGVPEHETSLIFERYYRGGQSPTMPGSVGIGLSVSRQLAQMMDGELEYTTLSSQRGFVLSLPLAADRARELLGDPF